MAGPDPSNPANAIPVYIASGAVGAGATPRAGTVSVVTTGGTAVTAITGPISGGYITNPSNTAGQGISALENLYVDPVVAPALTDGTAVGTTTTLSPGQSYNLFSVATGVLVRVNAATSGHKFVIVVW